MVFLSQRVPGWTHSPDTVPGGLLPACDHMVPGQMWVSKPSNNPNSQQLDKLGFRLLLGKYFAVSAWFSMLAKVITTIFLLQ